MHEVHAGCGAPVFWVAYDYGKCQYTGYHDSGHIPECEKCGRIDEGDITMGYTQVKVNGVVEYDFFGKGAEKSVKCPMCHGEDAYCTLCDGTLRVSLGSANEFRRQNPGAL